MRGIDHPHGVNLNQALQVLVKPLAEVRNPKARNMVTRNPKARNAVTRDSTEELGVGSCGGATNGVAVVVRRRGEGSPMRVL